MSVYGNTSYRGCFIYAALHQILSDFELFILQTINAAVCGGGGGGGATLSVSVGFFVSTSHRQEVLGCYADKNCFKGDYQNQICKLHSLVLGSLDKFDSEVQVGDAVMLIL